MRIAFLTVTGTGIGDAVYKDTLAEFITDAFYIYVVYE